MGATHTASMATSVVVTLVIIYNITEGDETDLSFTLATLAAWFSAIMEARARIQTGSPIGKEEEH